MKGETMKDHLGFSSLCLLLAVLLLSGSLQAAFKIDVHINSAPNPTLTFGEVESSADTRSLPHPPFSGMFGVVDVCFAGPKGAEQWYDRLAEDIKVDDTNTPNQWILIAKSNARLTFKLKESDPVPTDIKIVYYDPKNPDPQNPKVEPLDFGDGMNEPSFSVKAGGVYTITREDNPVPKPDPNANKNQFAKKGETATFAIPNDFTPQIIAISFVNTTGILAHDGEVLSAREIDPKDVDWVIVVEHGGMNVPESAYSWNDTYTVLTVTLPGSDTRDTATTLVQMQPLRPSAPQIQTTITDAETEYIIDIIDWILQKFGTLDVNKDGKFSNVDVLLIDAFQKAFASAYDDTENIDAAIGQLSIDKIKAFLRGVNKNFVTEEAFAELLNSWEEFAGIDGRDVFSNADVLVIDAIQKEFGNLFSEYENVSTAVENLSLQEIKNKLKNANKGFATEYSVEQAKALIDL